VVTSTLTAALLLRSRPYGESDRIVTFITEDCGKVTGIAKGAMRSRHRFVNTLEPFVKVRLTFRTRTRSDLAFVERCDLVEVLRGFGRDLDRFAYGSYVLELADRLVIGREPGGEIYRLVETTLATLDAAGPRPALLRAFELHLLHAVGYGPDLGRCRACGRGVAEMSHPALVPARGGVLCPPCRPAGEEAHATAASTLLLLAALQQQSIAAAAAVELDGQANAAETAVEHLITHIVARPLRSRTVLSALRRPGPPC
jgi:DNA repair protein RecO (recombination protein O)